MIYLLEDDDNIRNFVIYALNNSNMKAKGFERPSEFWAAVGSAKPQLVLLDIMLPEEDGYEVLKKLRSRQDTKKVPVIMLSAKGTEYDKVLGLDSGADDYIAKPFGIMELMSRINALLRRAGESDSEGDFRFVHEGLSIDAGQHVVTVDGVETALTYKEFELLCMLAREPGRVFTRDQILQRIWGYEFDGENRTVDVHIRTLRSKLGNYGDMVETVRGIGYKMGMTK